MTTADRTEAGGRVIPFGNNSKYKDLVPEDANGDGTITALEHYEYVTFVTNGVFMDQYDPRFDGILEAGDNIDGFDPLFIRGEIDYEAIDINALDIAVAEDDDEVTGVTIRFNSYIDQLPVAGVANIIKAEKDGKYYYGAANADFEVIFDSFDIYVDFLEDAGTDIGLIEDFDVPQDTVMYPGGQFVDVMSDGNNIGVDRITIDFINPSVKASKSAQTLSVTPMLISRVISADPNPTVIQKKMKVYTPKTDKTGAVVPAKKIPKADIQIENKMAETEPFLVATGINNFEGSIAMRQRKNGDLGYGYYKNDDFYYIFSEDE